MKNITKLKTNSKLNSNKSKKQTNPKLFLEQIRKQQETKDFSYISFMDKLSIDYVKEAYKNFIKKKRLFVVLIYMRNGKYDMITVSTSHKYFEYNGGAYLIDADFFKLNTHTRTSFLFYHEECALPFNIEFNMDDLREKLEEEEERYDLTINPVSLKGFINSQVIEKVLKGGELSKDMDFLKKLIVINLVVTALIGVVTLKSLGVF